MANKFLNDGNTYLSDNISAGFRCTIPTDGLYTYDISVNQKHIFTGNVYLEAQENPSFEITEIIRNYAKTNIPPFIPNDGVAYGHQILTKNTDMKSTISISLYANDKEYETEFDVYMIYKNPWYNSNVNTSLISDVVSENCWTPMLQGWDWDASKGYLIPTYPFSMGSNALTFDMIVKYNVPTENPISQVFKYKYKDNFYSDAIEDQLVISNSGIYNYHLRYFTYFIDYAAYGYINADDVVKRIVLSGLFINDERIPLTNNYKDIRMGYGVNSFNSTADVSATNLVGCEATFLVYDIELDNYVTLTGLNFREDNYGYYWNGEITLTKDFINDNNYIFEDGYVHAKLLLYAGNANQLYYVFKITPSIFDEYNEITLKMNANVYKMFERTEVNITFSGEKEMNACDLEGIVVYTEGTYADAENEKISPIVNFDKTNSRFFLRWMDRYGSPQVQPFSGNFKYSEGFEKEYVVDYKRNSKLVGVDVTPKILLNSNWIDEQYYPFYESIFISPYIHLYDAKEDKIYNMILKTSNYDEKTFKNQNKRLFNLQLELEFNNKQKIIY